MEFLEVLGMVLCILVGFFIIAVYGMYVEDAYNDRKAAHGVAERAKATRKWLFVIFFPVIWPIALLVWLVRSVLRGIKALVGITKEMQIGKKL